MAIEGCREAQHILNPWASQKLRLVEPLDVGNEARLAWLTIGVENANTTLEGNRWFTETTYCKWLRRDVFSDNMYAYASNAWYTCKTKQPLS